MNETKYIIASFTLKEGMVEEWNKGVAKNQDSYGFCVYEYSNEWATLMEKAINEGAVLKDVFMDLSHKTDEKYGITGYMFGASVGMLANWWIHGDELRIFHNNRYGVKADEQGTVNPAILTIHKKDTDENR